MALRSMVGSLILVKALKVITSTTSFELDASSIALTIPSMIESFEIESLDTKRSKSSL